MDQRRCAAPGEFIGQRQKSRQAQAINHKARIGGNGGECRACSFGGRFIGEGMAPGQFHHAHFLPKRPQPFDHAAIIDIAAGNSAEGRGDEKVNAQAAGSSPGAAS